MLTNNLTEKITIAILLLCPKCKTMSLLNTQTQSLFTFYAVPKWYSWTTISSIIYVLFKWFSFYLQVFSATRPKRAAYAPPDPVLVEKARQVRLKEIKMWSVVRELVFYSFFLWILMVISYRNRSELMYTYKTSMEQVFIVTNDTNHWFMKVRIYHTTVYFICFIDFLLLKLKEQTCSYMDFWYHSCVTAESFVNESHIWHTYF